MHGVSATSSKPFLAIAKKQTYKRPCGTESKLLSARRNIRSLKFMVLSATRRHCCQVRASAAKSDGEPPSEANDDDNNNVNNTEVSAGTALFQWRAAKRKIASEAMDPSRYHFQVLFVDDDLFTARVCEGLFERIATYQVNQAHHTRD